MSVLVYGRKADVESARTVAKAIFLCPISKNLHRGRRPEHVDVFSLGCQPSGVPAPVQFALKNAPESFLFCCFVFLHLRVSDGESQNFLVHVNGALFLQLTRDRCPGDLKLLYLKYLIRF